ncbi:MAG: hypothetical protein WCJ55_10070 [Chloroflexales bacterium]
MKRSPHKIYTGVHDAEGFRVTNGVNALRFNVVYAYDRCWHTEDGIRQLALDMLIDALDEPALPPHQDTAELADMSCAWTPHLHYVPVIAVLARTRDYVKWQIPQPQVIAWLHDWLAHHHRLQCARRYPDGSYQGLSYEAWETMFLAIIGRFDVFDVFNLKDVGMSQPQRMASYLEGHMPQDRVLDRCHRRFDQISRRYREGDPRKPDYDFNERY